MITIDEKSTRKEALEACKQHWQWLADNPEKDKDDWPELDPTTHDDCYCCEFMLSQPRGEMNRIDCRNCPLSGYAWTAGKWPACCDDETSLYEMWRHAVALLDDEDISEEKKEISLADRRKYALEMVAACDAALNNGPKRF